MYTALFIHLHNKCVRAPTVRTELATFRLEAECANQLRHEGIDFFSASSLLDATPSMGIEPMTTRLKVVRSTN